MSPTQRQSRTSEPVVQFGHIIIEDVTPSVDGGKYPAKGVVGEPCIVEADIFRDGHQIVRAAVKWRRQHDEVFSEAPMTALVNDRWRGEFVPTANTRYVFTIEAWTDRYASWLADFTKKVNANRDVTSDIQEGITLLEEMIGRGGPEAGLLRDCVARARALKDPATVLDAVSHPEIVNLTANVGERSGAETFEPLLELEVDRPKALFSSWYEIFVRSQ